MHILRRSTSFLISIGIAMVVVILLRTFVFQLYVVEQQSMENTIMPGSIVVVDKASMSFAPLAHGDIVVFTPPDCALAGEAKSPPAANPISAFLFGQSDYAPFIKRVIGLPGDKIVLLPDGNVSLNGLELNETYVNSNNGTQPLMPISTVTSPSELASGTCTGGTSAATSWTIGPGQVFVMGDHRDVSLDSRAFGPIAQSEVIGRVWLRLSGQGGFGGFNRAFWDGQTPIYYGEPNATLVPTLPPAAKPSN